MRDANSMLRFLISMVLTLSIITSPVVSAYAAADDIPLDLSAVAEIREDEKETDPSENIAPYEENTASSAEEDEALQSEQPAEDIENEEPELPAEDAASEDLEQPAEDIESEELEQPEEDAAVGEETMLAAEPAVEAEAAVNLARNKGTGAFTLEMEGAGTDLDPSTPNITIFEKEKQSLSRLTDGCYGNGNLLNGSWNGTGMRSKYYEAYRNIDRVITLDLGQMSNIQILSFHMQEGIAWGISAPSAVTYYLSEDGVDFRRVGRVTRFEAQQDTNTAHIFSINDAGGKIGECVSYYFKLFNLNYNARYVRLSFELTGTWAFADELEVWGTAYASENAAALPDTPGTEYEIVNHYATTAQSNGIRHEALAYAGHYISNGALKTSEKTVAELLPVVGYVNERGLITDTFFDSVTFLAHGYTPNTTNPNDTVNYYHRLIYDASSMTRMDNPASVCATKGDWEAYLDFLFDYGDGTESYNLDALEEAVGLVKAATDKSDYTVGVKVAFYPPISCQDRWGMLPGGDHSLNFMVSGTNSAEQARADRFAASKWYLDEVISRFAAKNYQNIRLDGFYWYDELMHYDIDPLVQETAQDVTNYVHSLNQGAYQIYWIPFYQANGFRAWKSFGFDYAIMQPNYAFDSHASEQRIFDTAELCKKYGLGIEMEFGGINDQYITKFRQYLTNGAEDNLAYQNDCLIGWYTGTWGMIETCRDKDGTRYIYDAMYDFFKGVPTTMEEAPVKNYVAEGIFTMEAAEVKDQAAFENLRNALGLLVDDSRKSGIWESGYLQLNKNQVTGPIVLTTELEDSIIVTQLSLDFIGRASWGIGVPDSVIYSVSQDGIGWTQVGIVSEANAVKEAVGTGFDIADYVLDLRQLVEAKYIRAQFDYGADPSKQDAKYTWLGVDEFTVRGRVPRAPLIGTDGTITLESEGVLDAAAFAQCQAVAAELLKDGKQKSGSWANVNTTSGDYVGLIQGVAGGPYTVQIAYDTATGIKSFGLDFMTWESAGVGAPDKVTYYASLDGEIWTQVAAVNKADAEYTPNLGNGIHGYRFTVERTEPFQAKYLKAVFERGHNPAKNAPWGWVAFDEFSVQIVRTF